MRILRRIVIVGGLCLLTIASNALAQGVSLKCGDSRLGQTTVISDFRPDVNGSYTYGLWTFPVKTGDSHTFTYKEISSTLAAGRKPPEKYITALKISGKAFADLKAPVEVFSLKFSTGTGPPSEYGTGGILDPRGGGLGFEMLQDGQVEVVVLIKDVKPSELKAFTLAGCDAVSKK